MTRSYTHKQDQNGMRQFVWITGAKPQKTRRFSRICNALAGQRGHTLTGGQSASICGVKGSNRDQATLFRLFLAAFRDLPAIVTLFMSLRPKTLIRSFALIAILFGAISPAFAQLSAKGGGILIDSDKLEVFDNRNEAIFTGRVDAVQDDARLRADKLNVIFDKAESNGDDSGGQPGASWGDVKNIVATGNVFYVTPKQVAKADKAVYDVINDQVTMSGNVVVTQGKNVIRGDMLVIKISTGRAVFDASKANGATSGRVRAAFFPAKKAKKSDDQGAPANDE